MTTTAAHLTHEAQRFLIDTAVEAIRARLEGRRPRAVPLVPSADVVLELGASFVTLRDAGRLLGCVGSMAPVRPLADDVANNARNAAFADPRLPSLTTDEFERMEVKISVLGPLEPVAVRSLAELRSAVQPGVDGLLITAGPRRGTFLPSVWEQVRSTDDFLSMLWAKAGLRPGTWPANLTVERYRTEEFGDPGPRPPVNPH